MSDYQPDFDIDFRRGLVGEDSHKAFLYGTHEVKTDYGTIRTGNFYIETWQSNGEREWQSGVNSTKADFWVQASPLGVGGLYIRTDVLKQLMRRTSPRETVQPIQSDTTNSSRGRLVTLDSVLGALGFRPLDL